MKQDEYQKKIEEIVRDSKKNSMGLSDKILKLGAVAEGDIEDIIQLLSNIPTYISNPIRTTLKEKILTELTPVVDKVKSTMSTAEQDDLDETTNEAGISSLSSKFDLEIIEKIIKRMHDYFYPTKQPDQSLTSLTSPDKIMESIRDLGELTQAQKADILFRGGAPKRPNPLQEVILKHFSEALDKKVKPIRSSAAAANSASLFSHPAAHTEKKAAIAAAAYRPEILAIINMIVASNNQGAIKLIQTLDVVQPGEREDILKKIPETAAKKIVEEKISSALAKQPQGTTVQKGR